MGITLVHEALHGFYEAGGDKEFERVVETYACRFYRRHKDFVDGTVTQLQV